MKRLSKIKKKPLTDKEKRLMADMERHHAEVIADVAPIPRANVVVSGCVCGRCSDDVAIEDMCDQAVTDLYRWGAKGGFDKRSPEQQALRQEIVRRDTCAPSR